MLRFALVWVSKFSNLTKNFYSTGMTTSHNYHHQLQSCINLAYEAGKIALQFCKENIVNRSQTLDVELKLDKSPVTIVDKQINDFLVTKLTELFPKVRVVGEESKLQTEVKDYGEGSVFFVDPIDGTEVCLSID